MFGSETEIKRQKYPQQRLLLTVCDIKNWHRQRRHTARRNNPEKNLQRSQRRT